MFTTGVEMSQAMCNDCIIDAQGDFDNIIRQEVQIHCRQRYTVCACGVFGDVSLYLCMSVSAYRGLYVCSCVLDENRIHPTRERSVLLVPQSIVRVEGTFASYLYITLI